LDSTSSTLSGYAGILGYCPQPIFMCLQKDDEDFGEREQPLRLQQNRTEGELGWDDIYETKPECEIQADRFVLIYFPPLIASRDLCADNGFGDMATMNASSGGKIAMATLTEITFHLDSEDKFRRASSLAHA